MLFWYSDLLPSLICQFSPASTTYSGNHAMRKISVITSQMSCSHGHEYYNVVRACWPWEEGKAYKVAESGINSKNYRPIRFIEMFFRVDSDGWLILLRMIICHNRSLRTNGIWKTKLNIYKIFCFINGIKEQKNYLIISFCRTTKQTNQDSTQHADEKEANFRPILIPLLLNSMFMDLRKNIKKNVCI